MLCASMNSIRPITSSRFGARSLRAPPWASKMLGVAVPKLVSRMAARKSVLGGSIRLGKALAPHQCLVALGNEPHIGVSAWPRGRRPSEADEAPAAAIGSCGCRVVGLGAHELIVRMKGASWMVPVLPVCSMSSSASATASRKSSKSRSRSGTTIRVVSAVDSGSERPPFRP